MHAKPDAQLLREYAQSGAEAAFAELVGRYTNLVYSAALRQVDMPEAAADVTQQVFIGVARAAAALAPKIPEQASLAGWLCRTTRNLAANLRRDEFRRQSRERQAMQTLTQETSPPLDWGKVRPLLDEAMAQLSEPDYDAVAMRFFNNQDLRSVGRALGVSDDAAQKRVARALEKLREHLAERGLGANAGALALALSANAVQPAPTGLATSISAAAITGAGLQVSTASTMIKGITMTTLQKTLIAVTLSASIGFGVYQARQASGLRQENQALRQQQASLSEAAQSLQRERDETPSQSGQTQPGRELLQLRNLVTALRRDLNEAVSNREEAAVADLDPKGVLGRINLLKRALKQRPELAIPELGLLSDRDWLRISDQPLARDLESDEGLRRALSSVRQEAKSKFASRLGRAATSYAAANGGQLPTDILQLKPFLDAQPAPLDQDRWRYGGLPGPSPLDLRHKNYPPTEPATLQRYQMTHSGNLNDLRPGQPVMSETGVVDEQLDTRFQIGLRGFRLEGTGKNQQIGWGGSEGPDLESMTPEQRHAFADSMKQVEAAKQSQ